MSGGSHGYVYGDIERQLVGQMYDKELDELMKDIAELAKALEWYDSSDIGIDKYKNQIKAFKEKWFKQERSGRLKKYIDEEMEILRQRLYDMI